MSDEEELEDPEGGIVDYGFVMPFVAVQSNGGPLDDDAYAAGWEMGELSTTLANGMVEEWERPVHTVNLPQLDLVTMRDGYRIETSEQIDETWTAVKLVKVPAE